MQNTLYFGAFAIVLMAVRVYSSDPCGDALENVADTFESNSQLTCIQFAQAVFGNNTDCVPSQHEKYLCQLERVGYLFQAKGCTPQDLASVGATDCARSGACFISLFPNDFPTSRGYDCGPDNEDLDTALDCLQDELVLEECSYTYKFIAALNAAGEDVCDNGC